MWLGVADLVQILAILLTAVGSMLQIAYFLTHIAILLSTTGYIAPRRRIIVNDKLGKE
jgi:hypothetical protein